MRSLNVSSIDDYLWNIYLLEKDERSFLSSYGYDKNNIVSIEKSSFKEMLSNIQDRYQESEKHEELSDLIEEIYNIKHFISSLESVKTLIDLGFEQENIYASLWLHTGEMFEKIKDKTILLKLSILANDEEGEFHRSLKEEEKEIFKKTLEDLNEKFSKVERTLDEIKTTYNEYRNMLDNVCNSFFKWYEAQDEENKENLSSIKERIESVRDELDRISFDDISAEEFDSFYRTVIKVRIRDLIFVDERMRKSYQNLLSHFPHAKESISYSNDEYRSKLDKLLKEL